MALQQVRKDTSNYNVGSSSQHEGVELCVIHKQFRYSSHAQLEGSTDSVVAGLFEILAMGGTKQVVGLRLPVPVYTEPHELLYREAEECTFLWYYFHSYLKLLLHVRFNNHIWYDCLGCLVKSQFI